MSRIARIAAAAAVLVSCGPSDGCTPIEALPVVSIDVEMLVPAIDPSTLVVCMDGACVTPGEENDPLVFPEETQARFLVEDDDWNRTVLVRTDGGETIVPPTPIELTEVLPNGPGCGGNAPQGWYEVTPDGTLRAVE